MIEAKKIFIYKHNEVNCKCLLELLSDEYELHSITPANSLKKTNSLPQHKTTVKSKIMAPPQADAVIICLNHPDKIETKKQLRITPAASLIPRFCCVKNLNVKLIHQAIDKGFERFITAEMQVEEIKNIINNEIQRTEIIKFFNKRFPGCFERTPYAKKILDIIVEVFPQRINEDEMTVKLNISKKWLQKECKKAFNFGYIKLCRIIRVYKALLLLEKTDFDNTEIALQLNYSEEGSMARDFRKELNITPNEARKKLLAYPPEQLFISEKKN